MRTVALLDETDGTVLWEGPLDEFAATNDYDRDALLADLIELQETEGRTPEPLMLGSGAAPGVSLSLVEVVA